AARGGGAPVGDGPRGRSGAGWSRGAGGGPPGRGGGRGGGGATLPLLPPPPPPILPPPPPPLPLLPPPPPFLSPFAAPSAVAPEVPVIPEADSLPLLGGGLLVLGALAGLRAWRRRTR